MNRTCCNASLLFQYLAAMFEACLSSHDSRDEHIRCVVQVRGPRDSILTPRATSALPDIYALSTSTLESRPQQNLCCIRMKLVARYRISG